jgi:hypothetical protein
MIMAFKINKKILLFAKTKYQYRLEKLPVFSIELPESNKL